MPENTHPHLAALRARLTEYLAGKPQYSFNPDADTVNGILNAMCKRFEKFNRDFCPCRRVSGDEEKDAGIVCPCAFHEEELARDGHCHCQLFTLSAV